jgi:hypothetical protein
MRRLRISMLVLFCLGSPALALAQRYYSFPHFASGGGWSSDIYVTNQGSQTAGDLLVSFFDDNGTPLAVATNLGTNTAFALSLAPGETKVIQTSTTGAFIVGHALVRFPSSASVRGSEIFRYVVGATTSSQVGVPLQSPFQHFSFPVAIELSTGTNTGVALANPVIGTSQNQEQSVVLNLFRTNGTLQQSAVVKLAAGQHAAKFLHELFPGLDNFTGSLGISAPRSIGALGLRQSGTVYGSVSISQGSVLAPFMQTGNPAPETEPNDSHAQAVTITRSGIFSGTVSSASDVDYYSFTGKKGDIVSFLLDTTATSSYLDSVLRLEQSDSTVVAENDQNGLLGQNDSFLQAVLPADGTYYVRVKDYWGDGGSTYAYSLHAGLASQTPVPAPQISAASPSSGKQGETVNLTISGTNLSGTTSVNFAPGAGITVSGIQSTATQVTCSIAIAADASSGARSITVTTPGGTSNALTFTVNAAVGAPQITSLNPSSGRQGDTISLTIAGTNLSGATTVNFTSSSGIAVTGIQSTPTQVTCNVLINASAVTGARTVTVTSAGGTSNSLTFTITATTMPQLTSLSPNSGKQGTTVALTITGTNLSGATAVNFSSSSGVTVTGIQSTATQVTCSVAIAASATTGSRSVSVTTPQGTSNMLNLTITSGTSGTAPTISNLSASPVVASTSPKILVQISGSFDFTDPDGDILYTGDSATSAKMRFTMSLGSSCTITSTGAYLNKPGVTSGHIEFLTATFEPGSMNMGTFSVTFRLLDAAGNTSNSLSFSPGLWYCEIFRGLGPREREEYRPEFALPTWRQRFYAAGRSS